MTTFFDSSALFSVLNSAETHHAWSSKQLAIYKGQGPIIIADIVYCELSYGMPTQTDVDAVVRRLALERLPMGTTALFKAGKAFRTYKEKNKGTKTNVLPDFLIGALADFEGAPLVTTNARDVRNYFPSLQIIEP